ncbi:hypothetical protein FPV67DRAFT_299193 [Lyophyllum atratum]|nr:hypothetical protein FPV67DRAFT_299193 [Lyophyllum atratum]
MDRIDRHAEGSYFPIQPTSQPVRTGDTSPHSSSSSRDALPSRPRRRPATPPFPPSAPLPLRTPDPFATGHPGDNDHHTKGQSRPKSDRQAYAHFLSRLRGEERQEPAPRSRSRSNSSGANTLLRLLAHETARADAAERELMKDHEAVISRVRSIKEAQLRAEAELVRVTSELALYKLQLDIAQREILRAQTIVDDVERARAEAEERGVKDREQIRKLVLQRAVEVAREEGRREGWKLGLERGRWDAWASEQINEGDMTDGEDDGNESIRRAPSPPTGTKSSGSVAEPSVPSSRDRTRERSNTRGASRKRSPPDVGNDAPPLPIAAPIPLRGSASPPDGHAHESSDSPEDISIVPDRQRQSRARTQSPPHSPRSETRSPSIAPSRRSYRSRRSVPPEGYIPTLGPDAHISLPPPHELSMPVDFTDPADSVANASRIPSKADERGNGKGKGVERRQRAQGRDNSAPVTHSHAYKSAARTHSDPSSDYDDVYRVRRKDGRDTPALSTVSRVSTRISQYDIVSPPKAQRDANREERYRDTGGSQRPIISYNAREDSRDYQRRRQLTPPEKIVEDWRSANSDIVGTPTPQPGGQGLTRRTPPPIGEPTRSTHGELRDRTEVPTMVDPIPSSPRVRSPRVSGGPRQPIDSSQVIPKSSPRTSIPGSYIYRAAKKDHRSDRSRPSVQPPSSPSSAANIYRQPTASSLRPSPPTSQRRNTMHRSISNVTVPGIDVEPPSHSPTNSSEGTIIDPILLTPEHANRPTALPEMYSSHSHRDESSTFSEHPSDPVIVNQLPPGFVPLSPIPTMTNFKSEDHDHRTIEHFGGHGYQIYAGMAHIPETRIQFGAGPSGYGTRADSLLFGEPPRPSTAAAIPSSPRHGDDSRKRVSSFGDSPAPLNRPFSIFSDD